VKNLNDERDNWCEKPTMYEESTSSYYCKAKEININQEVYQEKNIRILIEYQF
jgi:hypothetical protein